MAHGRQTVNCRIIAQIRWIPEKAPGERVPEMLVSFKGMKFEVECKAKMVDSGRKVERGVFVSSQIGSRRTKTISGYAGSHVTSV
jgi:hypothetical protein